VEPNWGFTVWKVPHRPWAFFATAATSVSSPVQAQRVLADILESGRADVVIEGTVPTGGLSPGSVLSATRAPERVIVEAESTGNGLLVVQDAFWPGWKACIDGRPVPILAADALVRAVPWPAGRHVLEMRYEPREVNAGLAVSVSGLALLCGLCVSRGRRFRHDE
jgi:hypothetical protein